ncbi:Radical SAM domain protein [Metallosphaera sedula]|uniref:Radical SAM domain protein n=3 Tax=Metallosphaera TaxID=41980 RepID=A4YI87_METS5|nr:MULTISPECIES: AmmeMemoRadiSam system radical SAM enzyme [Metallosphaera]ABP96139.1 Radical SAM domain protein [Metallosphaera sedula DSM 5348]AIM28122.1 Radical SAM domain protein [Metallosphaera sedula]AKV74946.1 pyruvate-formate lyase [Metallosphaera sedula]AKV77184.1 pyruvate-formate lyase [Metallosphaera sedula]AKV79434.1 pyruvate-formate lyase [Metallosphaera sedula]
MQKEAILYTKLDGRIRCDACARKCLIGEGQVGFCGVRSVSTGKLYLNVYGKVAAAHIDPIEKKPLVHFYPGSRVLSFSTFGCNWMCMYCQNYDISQRRVVDGADLMPEDIVDMARAYEVEGITYTYNEPAIFAEFAHDTGVLARKFGLLNTMVTNGYWSEELVDYVKDFLDAVTVDFKGNGEPKFMRRYTGASGPDPIFNTISELIKRKIHVEITDLIIPEIGDNLEFAKGFLKRLYDVVGPDVPIHFLRFHPDYKLNNLPLTPVETLEAHYKIAKQVGFRFAYVGNVPGHPLENTYCPQCGNVAIRRYGFRILEWNLTEDMRCTRCGYKLPIEGRRSKHYREDRFESIYI